MFFIKKREKMMKYTKFAILGLMVIGLGAKIEAITIISRDFEKGVLKAEKEAKSAVTGIFKKSGHFLPDICRFTNDTDASIWVSKTGDLNGQWDEVKPGQNAGPHGAMKGPFTVRTRDPKKLNITMVGQVETFQVNPLTECPGNQLKFSELKKTRQAAIPAAQPYGEE
jgi:hypothetical protein